MCIRLILLSFAVRGAEIAVRDANVTVFFVRNQYNKKIKLEPPCTKTIFDISES